MKFGNFALRLVANTSPALVVYGCEDHWPVWAMAIGALFVAVTNYCDGRNSVVK
jgi:hypothetical protein